jgi:hypothetical protein
MNSTANHKRANNENRALARGQRQSKDALCSSTCPFTLYDKKANKLSFDTTLLYVLLLEAVNA